MLAGFDDFLLALFDFLESELDVVIDAVEDGALLDDQHRELTKELGEFADGAGNLDDLLVAFVLLAAVVGDVVDLLLG